MGCPGSHSRGIESQFGTTLVRLRCYSSGFKVGYEHRDQWGACAEAVRLHQQAEHLPREWRGQHRVAQVVVRLPVATSVAKRFFVP